MGEQRTPPKGNERKMTYRVGWKSGTIHVEDKGTAAPSPRPASQATGRHPFLAKLRRATELLFTPAPLPPLRAWPYILLGLPLVSLLASWWLIYKLSSFQ